MTKFKEGDKVEFEHIGNDMEGTIIEVLSDKVRIKDARGYLYRYSPENVRHKGEPKPTAEITSDSSKAQATTHTDSSNTNTNNQTTDTMAKKAQAEKKPAKASAPKAEKTNDNGKAEVVATTNPALAEQAKKIVALTCKKHQKIWLLHSAGLEKADVMKYAGCNAGEISNVRKSYADKPEKVKAAEALLG